MYQSTALCYLNTEYKVETLHDPTLKIMIIQLIKLDKMIFMFILWRLIRLANLKLWSIRNISHEINIIQTLIKINFIHVI